MSRQNRNKACKCGESRGDAMTDRGVCYRCSLCQDGKKVTERHHAFGRHNSDVQEITIEIDPNWHRVLHALHGRRPPIFRKPGDNTLHQIAAVAVRIGDAADALAEFAHIEKWPEWVAQLATVLAQAAEEVAGWLLILAAQLDEHLGSTWEADLGMPPFVLK